MSAHTSPGGAAPSPHSSSSSPFTSLSLPFATAVTLAFLVFISSFLLASYVCCSRRCRGAHATAPVDLAASPRIIFVAEDDDGDGGRGQPPGLDRAAITSYPRFPFSAAAGGDSVCSICLCEYREGEMLRMLPDCGHCFHLLCIDVWLRLNASCPVCRTSPLPTPVSTPLSTPLSELVPLSQFAADRRRS